jgi:hypothetical protein
MCLLLADIVVVFFGVWCIAIDPVAKDNLVAPACSRLGGLD